MSNILEIGSEWDSIDALKHACTTHAIEKRFPTKIVKWNANQFDMRCKNDGCIWRVYASKYEAPKFVIKKFVDEHYNCPDARMSNSAADSHFIANVIVAKVKEKPEYAPCEILQDINHDHRIKVSYWQAFRAKQEVITRSNLDETPEFEDSELRLTWLAGRAASDEDSDAGSDEDSAADELLPPDVKTKAGRPRKRWIRGHSEVESARKRRCGRCTEFGHNARSCTNPLVCFQGPRSMNS